MAFVKGTALGIIGAIVLSYILGKGGASSPVLAVKGMMVMDIHLYWSWPIFLACTALATAIFWMMDH